MKKNILPVTFKVIHLLLIVTFITRTSKTHAQYNCVDYAKHQYPKTVNGKSYEWNAAAWNFVDIQQLKPVSGLNIGSQGFFHGLLEHLPPSYATNTTAKYPVIIYFHGNASNGSGTAQEMCK